MVENKNQISVKKQCDLLSINRSFYYYKGKEIDAEDLKIMSLIDEIYLEHPYYGSRRLSKALQLKGVIVGRKKVRRLMRMMGIAAIYPRTRMRLSIPGSGHTIFPYLLRGMIIKEPNKVWCADITYIRLENGFAYLVAIMDWASRKVLSWRLSNTMDSDFCVEAYKEAITQYGIPEIFNSDQGSQFTSKDFIQVSIDHGIKISMDGKGRFIDNIFIERLWRSVKHEEVYLNAYSTLEDCRKSLKQYFQKYNAHRLHQSLKYKTPDEYYFVKKVA